MKIYEQVVTMKSWAEDDRPREKLIAQGRRSLTDTELIAILINSGSSEETAVELSRRVLHSLNNDLNRLAHITVQELSLFKGIGHAKAIRVIAALELGRRRKEAVETEASKINDSKDIHNLMSRYFSDLTHEEFRVVLLGRPNKFLSHHLISIGGLSETIADPKMIFRIAIEHRASSIILLHNHPSGNPKPSRADITLTNKLCTLGQMMDIGIPDHVIFTNNGYFSFADEGLI